MKFCFPQLETIVIWSKGSQLRPIKLDTHYLPAKCNFAVSDGFWFEKTTDSLPQLKLTLVQMTISDDHRPTASALSTFWNEMKALLGVTKFELKVLDGASHEYSVEPALKVEMGSVVTVHSAVQIHIIWLLRRENFDRFKFQNLDDGPSAGAWQNFWNGFIQSKVQCEWLES